MFEERSVSFIFPFVDFRITHLCGMEGNAQLHRLSAFACLREGLPGKGVFFFRLSVNCLIVFLEKEKNSCLQGKWSPKDETIH